MLRRHAGWIGLVCTFGSLSGVLCAQYETRCSATNVRFDPPLNGVTTWYNNAWRFYGASTVKFDCTSGYQSDCGICTRTTLTDGPTGDVVGAPTYRPYAYYTCGSGVSINLSTWAGPLITGNSYLLNLAAWSLSPTNAQCPPPGDPFPDGQTSYYIEEVPPPPQ